MTFVVVFGRIKSPPLIVKETLLGLGMLKIQPNGSLAEPNSLGTSSEGCVANAVKDTGMLQSTVTCLRALERWKTRNAEKRS